ncbi:armadillo-type protein [Mycena rosella]|uniref:Vacuolar protein 8 n=1 Tax=Mycena rosella TaxID=1033263 RepID=A0AAD7CRJ5_MYCRO|nr:armadillo-type protein [Mycena rosella]
MHPATRQRTPDSIRSWWSDSNPRGPNINLHAAAKPLMKLMYHRKALAYIAENRGTPLSQENMETYSSYLSFKYVSPSTKTAIILELYNRARSEDEARIVVDSQVLDLVNEFLRSSDRKVLKSTCLMLGMLACHESTLEAVLGVTSGPQIVTLLHDTDTAVIECAVNLLLCTGAFPDEKRRAVNTKMLQCLPTLLKFPDAEVRRRTCETVAHLAEHKTSAAALLNVGVNPCLQLVTLLREQNITVIASAAHALARIATSPEGARAAGNAKLLDVVPELLVSLDTQHSLKAILSMKLEQKLVLLLRDTTIEVIGRAAEALFWISMFSGGARAVVEANFMDVLPALLESPAAEVRMWACRVVGSLTASDWRPVLAVNPSTRLVPLLHDANSEVIEDAVEALCRIAYSSRGAQAVVDAKVLDYVSDLLGSPVTGIQRWTCELLGALAHEELTVSSVLRENPYQQLVSLLRGDALDDVWLAAYVLSGIAQFADGEVRIWISTMLGWLASHETTASAVVGAKSCLPLVSLLFDRNLVVIERAVKALSEIAKSLPGAQAAVEANVMDFLPDMLSLNTRVPTITAAVLLLERLVHHDTTRRATLALNPCPQLVPLLKHANITVHTGVLSALASFSQIPDSLVALAGTDILAHVSDLMDLADREVRLLTCVILMNIAQYKPGKPE